MHRYSLPLVLLSACVLPTHADLPTDLIARYVNEDTLVVARVQFDSEQGEQLAAVVAAHTHRQVWQQQVWQQLEPRLKQGFDRPAYFVLGLGDVVPDGGPLVILPKLPEDDDQDLVGMAMELHDVLNPRHKNNHILLANNEETLDRYEALAATPRPDLLEPLAELLAGDNNIGVVVALSGDARRVVREMFPTLPPPFDAITGPMLADHTRHITVEAKLPPEWSAQFTITTSADSAAETLVQAGEQALAMLVPLIQPQLEQMQLDAATFAEALTPQRDGGKVHVQLTHENEQVAEQVAKLASAVVGDAREAAHRNTRMNNSKILALAMHNFHDRMKSFPASSAIVDAAGKPLLSWRVAILRELDETELFNEFRLDESWDSEHNLKLLDRMPWVFSDLGSPNHEGKTTFQVPVHPETVFPPEHEGELKAVTHDGQQVIYRPGTTLREITDGTSNTIMIVEVAPDRAVPWTKPADWEVDLDNPLDGLKHEEREGFVNAFCDGSVHFTAFDIDPKRLRALLTRAGREVIEW